MRASDLRAADLRVGDEAPAPFARLLVIHRGPMIERDLLDYAAWVAAMSGASAHLLVAPC
jgi:hypothetical protein